MLGELCGRPLAESRGHRAGFFATQVRCAATHVANLVAAVELIIILLRMLALIVPCRIAT